MSVYQIVTERIMTQLKAGTVPWRQPWTDLRPINWKTGRPYRGINTFLLPPGEYATFRQIQEAGGRVKRGSKAEIAIFWKLLEKENPETGEIEAIPVLRYYHVFNVVSQVEGLTPRRPEAKPLPIAERLDARCRAIVKGYKDRPPIYHQPGGAYYVPQEDVINLPLKRSFCSMEHYYATLFHELIHSTGHEIRLNRPGVARRSVAFGDEEYSKEELIAEMGAAFLCAEAQIDPHTEEQSAAYIQSWLQALTADARLVVVAAAQAQKAADYILGRQQTKEEEEE